ncbi:MAG: 3-deoxy-7-phosphoheptulonate synthase, partial [Myxococcota bacterium]
MTDSTWTPYSWRAPDKTLAQVPDYPDPEALHAIERQLRMLPPLLFAGEARQLKQKLAEVAAGRAFVLQGGDCAESFAPRTSDNQEESHGDYIRDMLKVLLQMSVVLTFGAQKHIVKIGRLAGQYAKPRSRPTERRGEHELPSYRGDIINGAAFTLEERTPDPHRMLQAYTRSAATLNLLRGFTKGGYADLRKVNRWNMDFVNNTDVSRRYSEMADHIQDALSFVAACGVDIGDRVGTVDLYTSHEALLLFYEAALTRQDSSPGPYQGRWYDTSAHFLWVGNRTRDLDSAHIEYLRGIDNPIGIKVGPGMEAAELLELLRRLDPHHEPGRITLISRFGA